MTPIQNKNKDIKHFHVVKKPTLIKPNTTYSQSNNSLAVEGKL